MAEPVPTPASVQRRNRLLASIKRRWVMIAGLVISDAILINKGFPSARGCWFKLFKVTHDVFVVFFDFQFCVGQRLAVSTGDFNRQSRLTFQRDDGLLAITQLGCIPYVSQCLILRSGSSSPASGAFLPEAYRPYSQ